MRAIVVLLFYLLAPLSAGADDPPGERSASTRVQLSATVTREVANDLLRASLAVEAEGPDAAALAQRVNGTMGWALERVSTQPAVKAESGSYQTYAVHEKSEFKYWRARQRLELESLDTGALTALVGALQTRLVVKGMHFILSTALRRKTEDSLIAEAIDAFRHRAGIVQESMNASSYRIRKLKLNPELPVVRAMPMALEAGRRDGPRMEAGTTAINVTVSGEVELLEKD